MRTKRIQQLTGLGIGLVLAASNHAQGQVSVFNFSNFTSVAELALHGDALRVTDRLRLVPAGTNRVGAVWFGAKRFLSAGFETTFQFQIAGAGGSGTGEGFAFVIQNSGIPALGPAGGGLGYGGVPNSLAVEFDTFQNTNFLDATANHIGVQTHQDLPNSPDLSASLSVATNLPALADGTVHTGKIVFVPDTLRVFVDDLTNAALAMPLNLETLLHLDNGQAWFGFTAATGRTFAEHDLLNWSFATSPSLVNITHPVGGASYLAPANIEIAATTGGATTTKMEFHQKANKLGETTNAPFSFAWTNVPPGAYLLTAVVTDNTGRREASPPIKVTVLPTEPPAGIHFSTGNSGANFPLAATDLAGAVAQRNWNNLASVANGTGSASALKNGNGAGTTLAATYDFAAPAENSSVNAAVSSSHKLMKSFLSVPAAGSGRTNGTLTVANIPFARYDVIVYSDGDNGGQDQIAEFRIGYSSLFLKDSAWAGAPSILMAADGLEDVGRQTSAGNYVRFYGLSSRRFTLTVNAGSSSGASPRAVVNGLQIVPSIVSSTPQLVRGPYLQTGTTNSVMVCWRTDRPTDSRVLYGTAFNSLTFSSTLTNQTIDHIVALTNLLPDTRYYYAIGTGEMNLAGGADFRFTTSPTAARPTRVWVLGDSGRANGDAAAVRDAYVAFASARPADFWLMLGDNAYDKGTDDEYQAALFDMYPAMLPQSVLWSTLGNHETDQRVDPLLSDVPYFSIFNLPKNGEAGGVASGTEKYYAFDYGGIHFVCLDSMTSDRTTNGPMLAWLEQDLAANDREWLIAFWHHPPYSKGSHDSDNPNGLETQLVQMRENVLPILESYGVDLVLSGHSHCYERSFLLNGHYDHSGTLTSAMLKSTGSGRTNEGGAYSRPASGPSAQQGTVYVVAGSSGQISPGSEEQPAQLNHPAMFVSLLELGSLVLDIDGNRLEAKFLRETGLVQDYFTILKPSRPRITTWSLAANSLSLTWQSTPGSLYRVERTDSLMAPAWSAVSGLLTSAGNSLSWFQAISTNVAAGFYRIATP